MDILYYYRFISVNIPYIFFHIFSFFFLSSTTLISTQCQEGIQCKQLWISINTTRPTWKSLYTSNVCGKRGENKQGSFVAECDSPLSWTQIAPMWGVLGVGEKHPVPTYRNVATVHDVIIIARICLLISHVYPTRQKMLITMYLNILPVILVNLVKTWIKTYCN